jgi:DNA modification methylase
LLTNSHDPRNTTEMRSLAIVATPIATLKPAPNNPRSHSTKQIRQLARSIETFGFNVPLLIDEDGGVIAGHGRLAACKRLGWTEVPCIRIEHLSEAQKRAYIIADNRLSENATWDDALLAKELTALSNLELSFEIEAIGFDMGEIDLRIESVAAVAKVPDETEQPIPEIAAVAVTRLGDLWQVGRHKLICADARDPAAYTMLFGTEHAAAMLSDPPFNVKIDGHVSGLGKVRHREFVMGTGEMSSAEFIEFLVASLKGPVACSAPGAVGFVFMDWRHMTEVLDAARLLDLELLNLCVWTKPNAGMGSLYRSQHELCFVFKLLPGHHRNNVQLGSFGRNRSNVWPYAAGPGFGRPGDEGKLSNLHPTVKPVTMVADAILDVTRRGDIVLDPFLGSGTTLLAAERVGRRCFGFELDPLYCDVILRRWHAYTGEHATLVGSGEPFSAVEQSLMAHNTNVGEPK